MTAFSYSIKVLGNRDYTEFEIKEKLIKKGFETDEIISVLSLLKEKNYINDTRYIINFITFHADEGKHGSLYIKNKLTKKGLNKKNITTSLSKYLPETKEKQNALLLLKPNITILQEKALKKTKHILDTKNTDFIDKNTIYKEELKKNIFSYLKNRGFIGNIIYDLIKNPRFYR